MTYEWKPPRGCTRTMDGRLLEGPWCAEPDPIPEPVPLKKRGRKAKPVVIPVEPESPRCGCGRVAIYASGVCEACKTTELGATL